MRLFVAIDIPEDVRAAVGALIAKLRGIFRKARWVKIDVGHVTLKFIGEVHSEKLEGVRNALGTVSFPSPITIHFRNSGFFPDERRPRVFWAGIEAGPALAVLAGSMESALESVGIPREDRAFSPHLTLARLNSPRDIDPQHEAIAKMKQLEFGASVATEFVLYRSVLKSSGAEYTRLATFRCSEGELQ